MPAWFERVVMFFFYLQDSNYELRLLSRRDKVVSVPSESVFISTEGEVK